ncbi:NTP transferase domain-containing protein [Campylobacter lari]|uniref:NTP transferase domain-containing protein n=1 Tax=Campylobacter lari TaxID=201 RepID=UPI0037282388
MNAIILAAGLGSRFQELSKITHKAMLKIQGVANIERTIVYLKEAMIDDIYIVIGHLKEQFSYLEKKYNVKLILMKIMKNIIAFILFIKLVVFLVIVL